MSLRSDAFGLPKLSVAKRTNPWLGAPDRRLSAATFAFGCKVYIAGNLFAGRDAGGLVAQSEADKGVEGCLFPLARVGYGISEEVRAVEPGPFVWGDL